MVFQWRLSDSKSYQISTTLVSIPDDFQWSLSDSKSYQISMTLVSIPDDFRNYDFYSFRILSRFAKY